MSSSLSLQTKVCSWFLYDYMQMGKTYQRQHSAREICITLMFVACVKWQFVNFKDFSRYPFLLPQLASDALQNVPFCSGERGLQDHALLAAATPSPRQLCLASSHLLPSLLLIQKVCFVRENCIFLVPGRTSTRFTETAPFGFSSGHREDMLQDMIAFLFKKKGGPNYRY
jgi:hypothetical protein